MVILQTKSKAQQYAFTKDIGRIFGYKDPVKLLKGFRDYADSHPKTFGPYKPYLKNRGMDTLYDIICFAFYFENRDLLEAGTRSVSFPAELPRLKEVYQS
ncbi:hypothetical protein [Trichococcus collinsii]|uniref:Uncharacterized protein n=1 Tax=Trichococcus collinsii TaxID=157076 RepID=A0AB37ZYK8_9LACT|nr:hypothetical protein [Trichococcus collinsii]CZR02840.1 Hypothetical protein Tcol_2086 [Trichococcus collinsii]SDZ96988.1 hypothetical protein SAMN04488525_101750 [Trichococcus collinsii]